MRSMLQCRTGGWRAELQEQPGTHEKALPAGGGWQSPPLPSALTFIVGSVTLDKSLFFSGPPFHSLSRTQHQAI